MIKSGGIEGEGIKWCFNLIFFCLFVGEWVGIGVFQGKYVVLEYFQFIKCLSMGSGKIDVLFVVDVVYFWCLDELVYRVVFWFMLDDNGVGGV